MAPHLDLRRRVLLLAKLGGSFLMERDVALALRLANASAPLPGAYGAAGVDAIGAMCGRSEVGRRRVREKDRVGKKIAFSRAFYARDLVGGV